MNRSNFDVVVVGAGAAGMTAAIGLARAGFSVAAVEAASFPGAENWSGCVYFTENLAHPDILGPEGVEELAWERRLVERGFFATDGHGLLGMTYRDPSAFTNCYTVLRPIFDHHLAQIALRHGVALLNATTAESLLRDGNRVIGVCTQRGPLYADLVFLAEGDASQLVTREGYERSTDPREAPKFLQGIKQVFELPPGAIEETFGVGPEEGVAYEMLVRNGTLRGKPVHLNMGGFVYTNRQSISAGLVLPADNLNQNFDGDPNLLIEWFGNLPALRPWIGQARRGVFGAKIIRGGGAKDIPNLIDDGLAIGGAASAVGIDFPYPNFTGPATKMGVLLVQAARRIREEGGRFTREDLRRHYLQPLHNTHYWLDVDFLRRWPGYVKRTEVFFGRNIDVVLGTAFVWTRPRRWFLTKWANWLRLVRQIGGPTNWQEIRHDSRYLIRALRLGEITDRPALGRFLLDGTINAFRDLFRRPRANLPEAGRIRLHYSVGGGEVPSGLPPRVMQRFFKRIAPVLAAAAGRVYRNDDVPLFDKLPGAFRVLIRQVNMLDLFSAGLVAVGTLASVAWLGAWDRMLEFFLRRMKRFTPGGLYRKYAIAADKATDLTPAVAPANQNWENRLAHLGYRTSKTSHIHLLWPRNLADKGGAAKQGLWHVCPAHVYEARKSPLGQLQLVVNFENCIKCETCWRTSDLVDWGRDGGQRFTYPVYSPPAARLLDTAQAAALASPTAPRTADAWADSTRDSEADTRTSPAGNTHRPALFGQLRALVEQLDRKIADFDRTLGEEPRNIDQARAEHLEMLARYAQQLAEKIAEVVRESTAAESSSEARKRHRALQDLATALVVKAQQRARRTWNQHYAWGAADGRQIREHFLAGFRHYLETLAGSGIDASRFSVDPLTPWLRAEADACAVAEPMARWHAPLDKEFPAGAWRKLEQEARLTAGQDALLRSLMAEVPVPDAGTLAESLHPPLRKAFLAELGRRDPSLAFRVASHLWARDLMVLASGSTLWTQKADEMARASQWTCFAVIGAPADFPWRNGGTASGFTPAGEAWFVPAAGAQSLVLLLAGHLALVPPGYPGVCLEPLGTLGLRGAGLARVVLNGQVPPEFCTPVDPDRILRLYSVLSAADLISIASGMADQLCRRAISHATGRVQFPGLFHDEEARDSIGKFGAVKKMIAEMGARRFLIETLDHTLSPTDFSAASAARAGLLKALVAEALGTAPGSLTYNAGQVFGGTGYSEDDILSKYYRDAAAWRFLGVPNVEIYLSHGQAMVSNWRTEAPSLANVENEVELFEQLAQRKALQGELDEVRNSRSRLKSSLSAWQEMHLGILPVGGDEQGNGAAPASTDPGSLAKTRIDPASAAEVAEGLARHEAELLASKALVLRTHARLERGVPSEVEIALLRVWLENAAVSLEEFEGTLRRWLDPALNRDDHPVVEVSAGPPVMAYAQYLATPGSYDSGDFLRTPLDLLQPRLVPDMVQADPVLAAHDEEFRALIVGQFGQPREGRMIYERYIEARHRPDAEDIAFCREHGFFRMPIPKSLGGEERSKLDYYLLIMNTQRLADVSLSLSIQVSSSLGTTPVLLARERDLPRAEQELGAFRKDTALRLEIQSQLADHLKAIVYRGPRTVEPAMKRTNDRLKEKVFSRAVLAAFGNRFRKAWQGALDCVADGNAVDCRAALEAASAAWKELWEKAEVYQKEISRQREACDLFLRWVVSGQISAFALTEPSAGSDTARVATRAVLRSVPVEATAEGTYSFVPEGFKESRTLLDATRLEWTSAAPRYRWSDSTEPALIRFGDYDYETDDPKKMRYVDHPAGKLPFTDIAQLRERDGRLWYDYWELNGAKMWITNGRICGIMALYAKTDVGVTGFIVDRHAEGLIVGNDEAKMGQNGSPTNELALQAVRVPFENVIGVEGRGQVNALETLNVGRAGLAMGAVSLIRDVVDESRTFVRKTYRQPPDWAQWRLERMDEARFMAEAVAYEVIGRFEHKQTKSVRMESAISKMMVSELYHQVIEWAEELHGLPGQSTWFLIEKRKRDARIMNIYEGTNEIQRFFVLRDLVGEVAPRWPRSAAAPRHAGREALELEAVKATLRQRTEAALAVFGQDLWQNPNLQANCFLLAEAAAWLKAAESVLARLAWLTRQEFPTVGTAEAPAPDVDKAEATDGAVSHNGSSAPIWGSHQALETGRRALERCMTETRQRLRRFEDELLHLRRGYYAPQVRAASLLFDRDLESVEAFQVSSTIDRPLNVLVVVDPLNPGSPEPPVGDGKLLDPFLNLSDADRGALETALLWRDQARAPVRIEVAAVGPNRAAGVLREALHLGVDRVRLVVTTEDKPIVLDSAANALAAILGPEHGIDVIISGGTEAGEEGGIFARLVAEALNVPFVGTAPLAQVNVSEKNNTLTLLENEGRQRRERALPAGFAVKSGAALREFTTAGYMAGLSRTVEIIRWPKKVKAHYGMFQPAAERAGAVPAEQSAGPVTVQEAAARFLSEMGLKGAAASPALFDGAVKDVPAPALLEPLPGEAGIVIVLIASEAEGRLERTAHVVLSAGRRIADALDAELKLVIVTSLDETAQRRALAVVQEQFEGSVVLIPSALAETSSDVRARLLADIWPDLEHAPKVVVGEAWAEGAFASLCRRKGRIGSLTLRVRRLTGADEQIVLETVRAGGKLKVGQPLNWDELATRWITFVETAEVSGPEESAGRRPLVVHRWTPPAEGYFDQAGIQALLAELKQEAGVARLEEADFIVDVGYGVGNRDGYELVIEPLLEGLAKLGVRNVVLGGSRKVTEELHLLPVDRQIGQSGVPVNPQILLAIGVSGAPQHLNYIGQRATIVAFNRDPEAPLMVLNRHRPRPRVIPVVGDLFQLVPAFTAALLAESSSESELSDPAGAARSSSS